MDNHRTFPGPLGEWLGVGLTATAAHLAVLAGGVVNRGGLALLREAPHPDSAAGWTLHALAHVWNDPAAPFLVAVVWALLAFLALYAALRRWITPYFASGVAALVLASGYPGWTTLLPSAWLLWSAPAALGALVIALFVPRRAAALQQRVNDITARRWWKIVWTLLAVVAVFIVAERVRLGLRGEKSTRFPYAAVGLTHGFDKELADLRGVTHLAGFVSVLQGMQYGGLRASDFQHCLRAHGAAARFVCRMGVSWGQARPVVVRKYLSAVGWQIIRRPQPPGAAELLLNRPNLQLGPLPSRGGIRYPRLWGFVDGQPSGNWFDTRTRVLHDRPRQVEIRGPVFRRAFSRTLWIEVECDEPQGVRLTARFNEQVLPVQQRTLAAGDRTIVRGVALLASDQTHSGQLLDVIADAPHGLLDFDLLMSSEEAAEQVQE
jgi:hypothetical protein